MGMKVFYVILLLLILSSNGTGFGRKKFANCRKRTEETLSKTIHYDPLVDQNATSDYHYDCDTTAFGVIQKIPYLPACSTCDAIEINFSSACIRCGMCLAIAEKINETLLDLHDMLSPNSYLNDTEIELFLRTICDHSFEYYGLREVDGKRYISDKLPGSVLVATTANGIWGKKLRDQCHYYLDELGELELYKQWQQWCINEEKFPNLKSILCRNEETLLRDCRNIEDLDKYEPRYKTYNAKVKISTAYSR